MNNTKMKTFKVMIGYKHSGTSRLNERETYTELAPSIMAAIDSVIENMIAGRAIHSRDNVVEAHAFEVRS